MPRLYHFTKAENVAAIRAQGILPRDDVENMAAGERIVWLTELPDTTLTDVEQAEIFERIGERPGRWLKYGTDEPLTRLTVRIGTHDRKLVRYLPWLRKHDWNGRPDPNDALMRSRVPAANWIYFGTIAPDKIVECVGEGAV
jgi:hypothetical protein